MTLCNVSLNGNSSISSVLLIFLCRHWGRNYRKQSLSTITERRLIQIKP